MKVIINADGRTCTTVNPLGDQPHNTGLIHLYPTGNEIMDFQLKQAIDWNQAQSERQTFEIDKVIVDSEFIPFGDKIKTVFDVGIVPGEKREAEIVNGKAVIK